MELSDLTTRADEQGQLLEAELAALAAASSTEALGAARDALARRELELERLQADVDIYLDEVADGMHPDVNRDDVEQQGQALIDRLQASSDRIRTAESPAVFDSSPALENTYDEE